MKEEMTRAKKIRQEIEDYLGEFYEFPVNKNEIDKLMSRIEPLLDEPLDKQNKRA